MNITAPQDIKVALIMGGRSDEREVSLNSGSQAYEALIQKGFQVKTFDPIDHQMLRDLIAYDADVAFIALHGKYGEDGVIQGALEEIGLPYTGSGVRASALAMDKFRSKILYKHVGLQTPKSILIERGDSYSCSNISSQLGEKVVVKPTSDGSALGVSIVHEISQLNEALEKALEVGSRALIESYIPGTEITIGVLGNENVEALPIIEIVPHAEFYNYEAKYEQGGSDHIIPARLDEAVYQKAQDIAIRAHKILGCRGMSRSDLIVDEENEIWILETNTIPGMTQTSLLPDAARHAGYSFEELCAYLIELALEQ
ncbi:MAG: D-alanine--D-alanine ligase [Coriobacteriia bacterium]|nr:D-alanine--D-alanine ligase [Coriobacteriia bacterium]